MDISPQRVRLAEFATVKRGLDPDEVRRFLTEVADELERAQNQSTAMEARARAAVARLQELSEGAEVQAAKPAEGDEVSPSPDQAETISRTLLLAQRTADTTVAEARSEAERITGAANEEASRTLETTREMSARLLDEARDEARRVGQAERQQVQSEVNSLTARRDFLESDVDHLEQFLVDQRSRLRDAATAMVELAERVPSGLGEVRRPLLSAAGDDVPPVGDVPADRPVDGDMPSPDVPSPTEALLERPADAEADAAAVETEQFGAPEGELPTDGQLESGSESEAQTDDAALLPGDDDDLVIITDLDDDEDEDEEGGPVAFSYDDAPADEGSPGTFRFGS